MGRQLVLSGGGPVGLSLHLHLRKLLRAEGKLHAVHIRHAEARAAPSRHPKAHFLDAFSCAHLARLLHSEDGSDDMLAAALRKAAPDVPETPEALAAAAPPIASWRRFVYTRALPPSADDVLGVAELLPDHVVAGRDCLHLSQHRLEALLRHALRADGGEVQYGTRVALHAGRVTLGSGEQLRLGPGEADDEAMLLVGCDGAASPTRSAASIRMQAPEGTSGDLQRVFSIHFRSPELARRLRSTEPHGGMLYFVFAPSIIAILVCHDLGDAAEFVLQYPYFEALEPRERLSADDVMRRLLASAGSGGSLLPFVPKPSAGASDIGFEVLTTRFWTAEARTADAFVGSDKEDASRVVLAGDSAHTVPPAGGFGLNSGFRDAAALAPIIVDALGQSEAHLGEALAEYSRTRRDDALKRRATALENLAKVERVGVQLGVDARMARGLASLAGVVGPHGSRFGGQLFDFGRAPLAFAQRGCLQPMIDRGETLAMLFDL